MSFNTLAHIMSCNQVWKQPHTLSETVQTNNVRPTAPYVKQPYLNLDMSGSLPASYGEKTVPPHCPEQRWRERKKETITWRLPHRRNERLLTVNELPRSAGTRQRNWNLVERFNVIIKLIWTTVTCLFLYYCITLIRQ